MYGGRNILNSSWVLCWSLLLKRQCGLHCEQLSEVVYSKYTLAVIKERAPSRLNLLLWLLAHRGCPRPVNYATIELAN